MVESRRHGHAPKHDNAAAHHSPYLPPCHYLGANSLDDEHVKCAGHWHWTTEAHLGGKLTTKEGRAGQESPRAPSRASASIRIYHCTMIDARCWYEAWKGVTTTRRRMKEAVFLGHSSKGQRQTDVWKGRTAFSSHILKSDVSVFDSSCRQRIPTDRTLLATPFDPLCCRNWHYTARETW